MSLSESLSESESELLARLAIASGSLEADFTDLEPLLAFGLRQSSTYLSSSLSVALSKLSMSISISSLSPTTLDFLFLMISTTLPSLSLSNLLMFKLSERFSSNDICFCLVGPLAAPPPPPADGFLRAPPALPFVLFMVSSCCCMVSTFLMMSAMRRCSAAETGPPPPPSLFPGTLGSFFKRFSILSFRILAHSCTSVPGGLNSIALSQTRLMSSTI
mmetsp:Transcript_13233/g.20785  ORF Transcript_13233/g.20785 Transcript_13233/m.20785 type:complete len:217 (-) Transcript_13233:1057-1707(-)